MKYLPLSDFCKTGSGGTPSRSKSNYYTNGTVPWVKSGELKKRTVEQASERITEEAIKGSSAKLLEPGCLLIAMYGATVGEVSDLRIQAATNQAICHVYPDSSICDKDYLYWMLRASKPIFLSQRVGGGQPNISQKTIKDLKIPLPPLAEQKRLATILDAADALRAKRQKALAHLDDLLQSTFLTLFGDPVTNPMGWEEQHLNSIFSLKHGFAFKSSNFLPSGKYVLLTPGNFFEKGGFKDRGAKQRFHNDPVPEDYVLEKGDILIAMTEQAPGLLGSPILVPENDSFLHNQRLAKVEKLIEVESHFIFEMMNSQSVRAHIHNGSTGIKVRHTSPTKIGDIKIGFPPLPLQQRFAAIVEKIEAQKARHRAHLAELDTLFASLQSRAFSGEL